MYKKCCSILIKKKDNELTLSHQSNLGIRRISFKNYDNYESMITQSFWIIKIQNIIITLILTAFTGGLELNNHSQYKYLEIYILLMMCIGILIIIHLYGGEQIVGKFFLQLLFYTAAQEIEMIGHHPNQIISSSVRLTYMISPDPNKNYRLFYLIITQSYTVLRILSSFSEIYPEMFVSSIFCFLIMIRMLLPENHQIEPPLQQAFTNPTKFSGLNSNQIQEEDDFNKKHVEQLQLLQIESNQSPQAEDYRAYHRNIFHKFSSLNPNTKGDKSIQGFTLYKKLIDYLPVGVILIQKQKTEKSQFLSKQFPFEIIYSNQKALKMFQCRDSLSLNIQMDRKVRILKSDNDSHQGQQFNSDQSPRISKVSIHTRQKRMTQQNLNVKFQTNYFFPSKTKDYAQDEINSSEYFNTKYYTLNHQIGVIWQKASGRANSLDNMLLTFEQELAMNVEPVPSATLLDSQTSDFQIDVFSGNFDKLTIVLLVRDVTHRNYIKLLKKKHKQQSKSLTFVSHEYRTPLNCIIEMLSLEIEERQSFSSYIKCALDNSKYLLCLSNDLLDHAQIKVGKFQMNLCLFNLHNIVSECLEMFQLMASNKNIMLVLQFECDKSREIISDPSRLKQIIINLIGNAFKFTLIGSITIKVKCIVSDNIEISVIDTGIGIRDEDKNKLFKAFGKLQNSESSLMNKHGVGLGLLISQELAQLLAVDENMGLQMESQFKKGTLFWFNLQDHKPQSILENPKINELQQDQMDQQSIDQLGDLYDESQQMTPKINRRPKFILKQKILTINNILVVDDNQFNIDIFKMKFMKLDIVSKVDYTISGILALEMVESKLKLKSNDAYNLIFLDLEMPILDGRKTAKLIKELYKKYNKQIRLVACSGYTDEEEMMNCIKVGFNDYLVKPFNINELQQILQLHYY